MRILLIDDDRLVRQTVLSVLAKSGRNYDMVVAQNGEEGLRRFHETTPDLVITDIIMPEKEGIEIIIEMRRVRPDVKIIAMSGGGRMGVAGVLHLAAQLGADLILPKPFDPDRLIEAVESCLRS